MDGDASFSSASAQSVKTPVVVPIRSLGPAYRERIATHLLALDDADRYLRFGYKASDEQIGRYVADLNFERDEIFGIYNRHLELVAMAHVAFA
ncbi:MAG: GNAT family N-acetyltransferase, partial [Burkholderiaceae bacterium]|nr:GNAT family N-acetyltransferase [Burkholderiaceae bacterium]